MLWKAEAGAVAGPGLEAPHILLGGHLFSQQREGFHRGLSHLESLTNSSLISASTRWMHVTDLTHGVVVVKKREAVGGG